MPTNNTYIMVITLSGGIFIGLAIGHIAGGPKSITINLEELGSTSVVQLKTNDNELKKPRSDIKRSQNDDISVEILKIKKKQVVSKGTFHKIQSNNNAGSQIKSGKGTLLKSPEKRFDHPELIVKTMQVPSNWQYNSVPVVYDSRHLLISIVIDDLGLNVANAERAMALPAPLTLSFMSYAHNLRNQTKLARESGHELMMHLPMEPLNTMKDPGPNVLRINLLPEENLRRMRWALDRFEGYIGINNHMGSRFTQHEAGMALMMKELRKRGLIFLDSLTVRDSVSATVAKRYGVPYIVRDVFIDHVPKKEQVFANLDELERIARVKGRAVGIAHPHRETLDALAAWLPKMESRGLRLVPLSALINNSAYR